jgi:hypothetical protein
MKEAIRIGLDIQTEALAEKYLGLPTAVGAQLRKPLNIF